MPTTQRDDVVKPGDALLPRFTMLYAVLNFLLAILEVQATAVLRDTQMTSRAALHFMTALSTLPIVMLRRLAAPSIRRAPVLCAFVLALALLIAALLHLLPALQVFLRGVPPRDRVSPSSPVILWLQLVLHAAYLAASLRGPLPDHVPRARVPAGKSRPNAGGSGARNEGGEGDVLLIAALRAHALAMVAARGTDVLQTGLSQRVAAVGYVVVAALTIRSALPVGLASARVLLHGMPNACVQSMRSRREQVLAIEGVVECGHIHMWEEAAGFVVGTLCVTVQPTVSKNFVLHRAFSAFDGLVDDLTVQVENWRGC